MDYKAIGNRIRKLRRQKNMSQEQLAEIIDISVTHMSHIETGSTKLSLPVLVEISYALSVSTDSLLFDAPQMQKSDALEKIGKILENCSDEQALLISDIVENIKTTIDKFQKQSES